MHFFPSVVQSICKKEEYKKKINLKKNVKRLNVCTVQIATRFDWLNELLRPFLGQSEFIKKHNLLISVFPCLARAILKFDWFISMSAPVTIGQPTVITSRAFHDTRLEKTGNQFT